MTLTLAAPTLAVAGGSASAADIFNNCGSGRRTGTPNPDACSDAKNQGANTGTNDPVVTIIKAAIEVLSYIIGIAAIITIIVSAIRLITSGGDSNTVASARTGLIYSLAGIAIVALANILVAYVLTNVN
jgi:Type IV secretion system pilin